MKLRGKLILSFCSVVLVILSVFGVITYMTFSEGFKQETEEFYRAKVNETALSIDKDIQKAVSEATIEVYPYLLDESGLSINNSPSLSFCNQLAAIASKKNLFRSLFLVVSDGASETAQLVCSPAVGAELNSFVEHSFSAGGHEKQELALNYLDGAYYFSWPLQVSGKKRVRGEQNDSEVRNYALVAEFDSQKFSAQIISHLDLGRGHLQVKLGDNLLFYARDKEAGDVSENRMAVAGNVNSTVAADPHALIFKSSIQTAGLDFLYVVPQKIFFENLLTLKNRIIAASLILAWIAVWVVLILAYRISRPILSLARVSNDMIKFNYTSPMGVEPSNDEIGDLAKSFETMRQEIERHVTLDPLTKTSNRRYLMHVFAQEIDRALRMGHPLSCIMLDIDYFKKINDTYGHQAGDEVLRELGQILIEGTRQYDTVASDTVGVVARYGGEEFTILLPHADIEAAYVVAERIRKKVESHRMSNSLSCTLSLGVSALNPSVSETPDELIKKADTALYQAKEHGRNKTVRFTES